MDTGKRDMAWREWGFPVAVALFLVAAFLPWTGWIVRLQMSMASGVRQIPGHSELMDAAGKPTRLAKQDPRESAMIDRFADDFPLQMAAVLRSTQGVGNDSVEERVRRLAALRVRFPDEPALYATILRYLCQGPVMIHRIEGRDFVQGETASEERNRRLAELANRKPADPEMLSLFDEAAARGASLDPDNLYFPFMRAIGLFAQGRDSEAIAAIHQAAQCSKWNEYISVDVEGRWRLTEKAYGKAGTLSRIWVVASIVFPHYSQLREATRIALYHAVERERAGDPEAGFQIRRDLSRIGSRMRVQGQYMIASLVGQAITQMAASRPGGSPPSRGNAEEQRSAERTARYVAYLNRIGQSREAEWFLAEREKGDEARLVGLLGMNRDVFSPTTLNTLMGLWAGGLLLLNNLLILLLAGGLAAFAARSRRIREGLPLHRAVRSGLILWGVALTLGIGSLIAADSLPESILFSFFAGVVALVGFFVPMKRGETWQGFMRNCGLFFAPLVCLLLFCAALDVLAGRIAQFAGDIRPLTDGAGDIGDTHRESLTGLLLSAMTACVLGVKVIELAIRSRRQGVPISVGVVRGIRHAALPTAAVLLMAYTAVVGATAYYETRCAAELEEMVQQEGPYLARLAGRQWPGPVEMGSEAPR